MTGALAGPAVEAVADLFGVHRTSTVVTVEGPRGAGRSQLLHTLRTRWRDEGVQVLSAAPDPTPDVALSAFHQLLASVAGGSPARPGPDRDALHVAFGWVDDPGPAPGPDELAQAAHAALAPLATGRRVVLVLDDADRFDDASARVLELLLRRLPPGVGVLRSVLTRADGRPRVDGPPAGRTVRLTPWSPARAVALLDRQPTPPTGRLRRRVLEQAHGNPAALVELARLAEAHPELDALSPVALPPTPYLLDAFAPGLGALPEPTLVALAVAAAARGDLTAVAGVVADVDPAVVCAPAVALGLVHVRGGRLHFSHPMTRAAAYHAVPPGRRRELHRRLAVTADRPGWRAWHRAVAADGPDEVTAQRLERVAVRLSRSGATTAAVEALVAAAGVSPGERSRRRRTALAARVARAAHDPEWAAALTAATGPGDRAPVPAGTPLGAGDDGAVDVAAAVEALTGATHDVYLRGRVRDREVLTDLVARTATDTGRTAALVRVWAGALIAPWAHREAATALVQEADPGRPLRDDAAGAAAFAAAPGETARLIGTAALLLDETTEAVRHLEAVVALGGPDAVGPAGAEALAFALLDAGRLREARATATALLAQRRTVVPPAVRAGAAVVVAVADAWTGSDDRDETVRAAMTGFDPHDLLHLAVRLRRAQGTAAASVGDHDAAWRHLRWLWAQNTRPVHEILCDVAVGDLAAAAVHGGHRDEAATLLAGVERRAARDGSLRRRLALHRARALLGPDDRAEHHFRLALVHPGGEQWPLERALARLDYAEWLRRRQRPADARPQLTAALDTFAARGASAWSARAEAELVASGVTRGTTEAGSPAHLTSQQRTIAELAAQGWSNRQIAEQLFLSVRTVTTHLSHVFRQLGVSRRMHLTAALREHADTPTGGARSRR